MRVNSINEVLIISFLSLAYSPRFNHGLELELISDENKPATTPANSNLRSSFHFDPKSVETKGGVCDGYDGILKVDSGDQGAASGTAFFTYVINQIKYAEDYNLIPWVHFDYPWTPLFERGFHDTIPTTAEGNPVAFRVRGKTKITEIIGTDDLSCLDGNVAYPGPPDYDNSDLREQIAVVKTSGIWEHYFEPVSAFQPVTMSRADIVSCASKPFVDLSMSNHDPGWHPGLLYPGMHLCAPWTIRGWSYPSMPKGAGPIEGEPNAMYNWLGGMRQQASRITHDYIHPKQWLIDEVDQVNPTGEGPPCLALHIRHSDKKDGRRHVALEEFLPYAQVFVDNGGDVIYLATDQIQNVDRIANEWPENLSSRVRRQEGAFLSNNRRAIFYQINPHRANTEALIDMYAMSRCGLIVHGYSAMSESAIYINGKLHYFSVNLEDPDHIDEHEFGVKVLDVIHQ